MRAWTKFCLVLFEHNVQDGLTAQSPDELIIMVMQSCDLRSLKTLSETCRYCNAIMNNNDFIWASQVWRMGAIEDPDQADLNAAIAAQYSTSHYYDDCTTWKRFFMKTYLTDLNWRRGRYRQTAFTLEGSDYEDVIEDMKLDPIRRAILLLSSNGRLRFVDFNGNTLQELPMFGDFFSSIEFDGTYLALVEEENRIHVFKRVADSFDFTTYAIMQMPKGIKPSTFRMKNKQLLAECPDERRAINRSYDFFHLNFFDLEHPDLVATLAMYGVPGCVDFDHELLYVTVQTLGGTRKKDSEELEGLDTVGSLAVLYKPTSELYEPASTADAFLNANLQPAEFPHLSYREIASRLLPLIQARQVLLDLPEFVTRACPINWLTFLVATGFRNRPSDDYVSILSDSCLCMYRKYRKIGTFVNDVPGVFSRNERLDNSCPDQLTETEHLHSSKTDLDPQLWQSSCFGRPSNISICNGKCVVALDMSDDQAHAKAHGADHGLVLFPTLSDSLSLPWLIPLPVTEDAFSGLAMDDTLIVSLKDINQFTIIDFSADVDSFSVPPGKSVRPTCISRWTADYSTWDTSINALFTELE